MDTSEIRAIIERALEPMQDVLGIPHYRIRVFLEPCDNPNHMAECDCQPEYYQAQITIDPHKASDEKGVLGSLRHELLHVVLADANLMRAMAKDDHGNEDAHKGAVWIFAIERMVAGLEKMLHNLSSEDLGLVSKLQLPADPTSPKS